MKEIVFQNLEIKEGESDEEMSDEEMRNSLWRADDQLATVLYEKTLFFISALFDNRVPKHKTLNEIKWEVYKKTAKVLLLGNFDRISKKILTSSNQVPLELKKTLPQAGSMNQ